MTVLTMSKKTDDVAVFFDNNVKVDKPVNDRFDSFNIHHRRRAMVA